MMWGFFHSCEHSVGLDNLEKTHASLWGWFAYVISLMISSPLFSLFFFLALLLVRNDTPWLYPLMVLFTSFYCPLLYLFFYFLGDFLNIAFGHFCWLFLFVCFAIVVLIAKSLCFFLWLVLRKQNSVLISWCNIFSYLSEDINDEFCFVYFSFHSLHCFCFSQDPCSYLF